MAICGGQAEDRGGQRRTEGFKETAKEMVTAYADEAAAYFGEDLEESAEPEGPEDSEE